MAKKRSFHNALAGTRYVTSLFKLFWNVLPIGCFVTVVQYKIWTFWCSESPKKWSFITETEYLLWCLFWAFQNGCLFGVMKPPFYDRSETVKKTCFYNKQCLETWLFIAFYNGYLLGVKKRLVFGRIETVKKIAKSLVAKCFGKQILWSLWNRLKDCSLLVSKMSFHTSWSLWNAYFMVVIELLFYGRYGTQKKSALRNEYVCFLPFWKCQKSIVKKFNIYTLL